MPIYHGKTGQHITKVSDISKCKDGTFNVSGQLTWQVEVKQPGSCTQPVRDALLTDDSGSIPDQLGKSISVKWKVAYSINFRQFNGLGLYLKCNSRRKKKLTVPGGAILAT